MALIEEFDKSGNWLFKRRSYLPLILYVLAFAVIALDTTGDFSFIPDQWFGLVCFGISFIGMFIRGMVIGFSPKATSGRNTSQGQVASVLNQTGIYSVVRHPLYLGNYFMWLGLIIYVGNIWFAISSSLLYWLYYERIMFAEEYFLRKKFEVEYLKWSSKVPSFFPKLKGWVPSDLNFSFKNILKREYSGLLATVVSLAALNLTKNYMNEKLFEIDDTILYLLIVGGCIGVICKFLNKFTNLLEVKGR